MTGTNATPPVSPNGRLLRPLRLAIFGASLVSDYGNPLATTARAVMQALTERGHEVTFLEERRNAPTVALLRERGAAPLRAFSARYPRLRYRTYEMPPGIEGALWLSRELATIDAVILHEGTPPAIIELLTGRSGRHFVRVAHAAGGGQPLLPDADLVISALPEGSTQSVPFGPAVMPQPHSPEQRTDVLLVGYDDMDVAQAARSALSEAGVTVTTIASGIAPLPDWPFVPEAELPARYGAARLAIVVGIGTDPLAAARALLPVAAGCPVIVVGDAPRRDFGSAVKVATIDSLPAQVAEALVSAELQIAVPAAFDATEQAERLVGAIARRLPALAFGSPSNN